MSRICEACGRGSNRANNRSHSRVATKRQQHVNLQSRKIDGVKAKVCTRCIKTLTKTQEQKVPQMA
jgi:ribosomal protein L28